MKRSSALQAIFRSYAGMTRIRFKGPAHRHLSTVQALPSEFALNMARNLPLSMKSRMDGSSIADTDSWLCAKIDRR